MFAKAVCGMALGIVVALAVAEELPKPLSGRVIDENGQPLAEAKVTAFRFFDEGWGKTTKRELASMETDADGRFHFDAQLMKKCAVVVAEKPGKCFAVEPVALVRSGEMVLRLGPAAVLEGIVVDDAGKPVVGAAVKVFFHDAMRFLPEDTFIKTIDARGRFSILNLPEGAAVKFDMSAPGYARALAGGPFLPGQKGLRFVLPPEGRLEGTVVEKNTDRPLPNVRLRAMSGVPSGMHRAYAKTDKAGRFTMIGLSGGKYEIETVGELIDNKISPPDWISSAEKIEVEAGKLTSDVKIEVIQGGMLEIVLTDAATGRVVKDDGMVFVSPAKDLRINHRASPSEDGIVRLRLPPGEYVVRGAMSVFDAFKNEKNGPFQVEADKTNRVTVAVNTGKPQADDSAASPASCVSGIVCDPEGKPVPRAKIQVLPLIGGKKELLTGEDGRFTIEAADIGPICCFVWIRDPNSNLVALGTAALGEDDPEEEKLGDHGIVVIRTKSRKIRLRPPVILSGVVSNPQGKPITGASVLAQVDGSHMGRSDVFLTTTTDRDGKYQLALAPFTVTSYAISAKAPDYSVAESVLGPSNLLPGKKSTKNLVLYAADRTVRGIVIDRQGKPVPGAVVTAKRSGGPAYPGCVVSDARGRFVLERLDNADTICLFARVPGRGWIELGSYIDPGDTEVEMRVGPCSWE